MIGEMLWFDQTISWFFIQFQKQVTSFFNIQMNNHGLADRGSIRNPVTGVLQSRVNSTAFIIVSLCSVFIIHDVTNITSK